MTKFLPQGTSYSTVFARRGGVCMHMRQLMAKSIDVDENLYIQISITSIASNAQKLSSH